MVFEDNNYRFCVKAALQILEEERKKLYSQSKSHAPMLYSGLHEFETRSVRELYFQAYLIEWIDVHWNMLDEVLKRHPEYTVDERKCMTLFFAEYFSGLVAECSNTGLLSKIAIPDLLKSKYKLLVSMIEMSDKWNENLNRLKIEKKKHREQFVRLIENHEKGNDIFGK